MSLDDLELLEDFAEQGTETDEEIKVVHATAGRLRRRNEQLEGALRFYADPETYHAVAFFTDPPCGEFAEDFSENHGHPDYDRPMPGAKAREALSAEPVVGGE